jgi:hypothetical protein
MLPSAADPSQGCDDAQGCITRGALAGTSAGTARASILNCNGARSRRISPSKSTGKVLMPGSCLILPDSLLRVAASVRSRVGADAVGDHQIWRLINGHCTTLCSSMINAPAA